MSPAELIGDVFARYLDVTFEKESDEGTARLMIDHLTPIQTVEIAKSILGHESLGRLVDLKLNKSFVGETDLPDDVLTSYPVTYFRNSKPDEPMLLVASTGDEEDQSLKEFVRIGAEELKSRADIWVDIAADGLAVIEEQRQWWEKALAGLCELRAVSLDRFADYIVSARRLVAQEGLPVGKALGAALPALHFPKDTTLLDKIPENKKRHKSAWKTQYSRIYSKNACFLEKQTPQQQVLGEDDLEKSFVKVRDDIGEQYHPVIRDFISSPSGWTEQAAALADCEWEEIRPLFDGLRRVQLNLGEETKKFYDEIGGDLLSEDDQDYLALLARRKKLGDSTEEDQAFYESHRNEIKDERKLRSAWDKFIYGRARECSDFVIGLAACIESLFNQAPEATKRTLHIRCDSASKRDLRDLNIYAGMYFASRYAGLKSLLGNKVKWNVSKLFDYPGLVEQWRADKKAKLNRSQAKKALQLKFFLALETETIEGATETASTQLIWTYDPLAVTSEFVEDWRRLKEHPLLRCQTGLDPINSKGIYQAVSLADVRTFRPSYGGKKGSFVPAYKKANDLGSIWREIRA